MSDAAHDVADWVIMREARREHLAELLAFVDRAAAHAGVDQAIQFDVRLAVEEVVTNVIEHGYLGMATGPVTVRFHREPRQVVVTVEDQAQPFDPARVAPLDPAATLEQRSIGGLGWHLVKQVMDDVRHERLATPDNNHGNRVTLVKRLSIAD